MAKSVVNDTDQLDCCQRLCQGRCCRYITIHIPPPRLNTDHDELSWFLAHENISVYFDRHRWHVEVRTPCKHLTRQNLCAIYQTRPIVCRGHDADGCEYPDRPIHDLQFDTKEDLDAWWAAKRARARQRRGQKRQAARRAAGA